MRLLIEIDKDRTVYWDLPEQVGIEFLGTFTQVYGPADGEI
jgi:hypothetical protein